MLVSLLVVYIWIGYISILFASDVRTNYGILKWGKRFRAGGSLETHIVICGNVTYKDLAGWLGSGWPTYTLLRIVALSKLCSMVALPPF